jgi:hypothetical protein
MIRTLTAALIVLVLLARSTFAAGVSCHIHPPGSTPEQPRGTIGPFDSLTHCEQIRQERFGSLGRCHCAADFSPRWLPPADPQPPGSSPLG